MEIFAWITAILFTIAWFPQIYKTWRTKSANDLDVRSVAIPCIASVSGMIYTAHIQEWVMFGGYVVGMLCTATLVTLCLLYG